MLVQLSKDPLKMFDDIWEGSETPSTPAFNVDISEDENAFHIEAEMPGVSKENISIGIEDDLLTIKGERKRNSEGQRINFHLTERTYGAFSRSFTLGELIDQDAIDASYEKGILHLTLQKAQPVSRKREIAIR